MNDFEFIKYIPTPGENYMGIAQICLMGKYDLLFKIMMRKDGTSFFPTSASFKVKDDQGQDEYLNTFRIDSTKEKEKFNSFIIENVKMWLNPSLQAQGAKSLIVKANASCIEYKTQQSASNEVSKDELEEMPF